MSANNSFRKRFREATGSTPAHYRENLRIETAKDLLRSTVLTTRQIAESLGFFDQYHMSRRFKSATGMSPTAYRRG